MEAPRAEAHRMEAPRAEAQRLVAHRSVGQRIESERMAAQRMSAERMAAERMEAAERVASARLLAQERLAAEAATAALYGEVKRVLHEAGTGGPGGSGGGRGARKPLSDVVKALQAVDPRYNRHIKALGGAKRALSGAPNLFRVHLPPGCSAGNEVVELVEPPFRQPGNSTARPVASSSTSGRPPALPRPLHTSGKAPVGRPSSGGGSAASTAANATSEPTTAAAWTSKAAFATVASATMASAIPASAAAAAGSSEASAFARPDKPPLEHAYEAEASRLPPIAAGVLVEESPDISPPVGLATVVATPTPTPAAAADPAVGTIPRIKQLLELDETVCTSIPATIRAARAKLGLGIAPPGRSIPDQLAELNLELNRMLGF